MTTEELEMEKWMRVRKQMAEKWDTSLGLDFTPWHKEKTFFGLTYTPPPTPFPPLFKGTKLVGHSDLEGKGDCSQLVKHEDYLYCCHMWSSGFSVVDVKDPASPQVVAFVPTEPHEWNIKCRVVGDILFVANEWKFFESPFPPGAAYHDDMCPKAPVQAGLKIFDVSNPKKPKQLSFFKSGEVFCHRFWVDERGYAYLSTMAPGYSGRFMMIVDVSDPRNPKEVGRWWYPGQWTAGGERPTWRPYFTNGCSHHPIVSGDRAYLGYWGLGGVILDVSNVRRPTLVSSFNHDMGGMTHTLVPIKNRNFLAVTSEYRFAWMLDISDEKYPRVIEMFPKPPKDLQKRGFSFPWGPALHNLHENAPGSMVSDDRIYATCGVGGLRIYDVSDPYRIEEIGYYVPGTPEKAYDPRGPVFWGVDVMDVFVDNEGLIYLSSYNNGLDIVEFTE